ncbi:MAG: XkdX family protein [Synergistaceae bacterium]|nr:XkdX family protein [Synergistaceae bacterium]
MNMSAKFEQVKGWITEAEFQTITGKSY